MGVQAVPSSSPSPETGEGPNRLNDDDRNSVALAVPIILRWATKETEHEI